MILLNINIYNLNAFYLFSASRFATSPFFSHKVILLEIPTTKKLAHMSEC
ncbi:hypothetical protein BVRB_5g111640 isoform B [Beta vulgaris subsp. vulgaris]|nr:hypothetical protein BVRB_5g111640 isoform B [Beta vulgaris subsp. vulgaris]